MPFNQGYVYDAFNNMTYRAGTYYYQSWSADSGTYQNNKRQDWDYFTDGQVKHTPIARDYNNNVTAFRDWSYDAAGRMIQVKETITATNSISTYVTSYDGDGQQALEYSPENPNNSKHYIVRSSVLGGKVLTRTDYLGNKTVTTFSVDGLLTVVQYGVDFANTTAYAFWKHIDPLGLSEAEDRKPVYDPLGNYIAWQHAPSTPPNWYPPNSSSGGRLGSLFGFAQDKSCTLDGLPMLCQDLAHKIDISNGNIGIDYVIRGEHYFFPAVPRGLSVYDFWVPNKDGTKLGDASPGMDPDDVVRVNHNENDGLGHYESFLLSVAPQNYAQGRERLKGDTKVPDINIKREYLTDCVRKYLSKFFGGQSLAGIEVQRDYLPPIAPDDALAFTNTGSLISFNKGQYQPNTKEGIALIGHETQHIFQARKYGDPVFAMLYLGDSAALLYEFKNLDMAYLGNRFEMEAFKKQDEIEKDLAKNGNPCPP